MLPSSFYSWAWERMSKSSPSHNFNLTSKEKEEIEKRLQEKWNKENKQWTIFITIETIGICVMPICLFLCMFYNIDEAYGFASALLGLCIMLIGINWLPT